jgi:hypothetical protein
MLETATSEPPRTVVVELPPVGASVVASGVSVVASAASVAVDSSAGETGAAGVAATTALSVRPSLLAPAGSKSGGGSKTPLAAVAGSVCARATCVSTGLSEVAPTSAAPRTAAKTKARGRSGVTFAIYSAAAAFVPPPGVEPADVPPLMTTPMPVALLTSPPLMVTPGARVTTSPASTAVVPPPVVTVEPV